MASWRKRTQTKKKRGKNDANGAENEREEKESNGRKAGIPPKTTPLTPTMNEGAGKKGRRRMATTGAATTMTTTTTIGKAPRGEVGCQNEEEEEEMRRRRKEGGGEGKEGNGWRRRKPIHSE